MIKGSEVLSLLQSREQLAKEFVRNKEQAQALRVAEEAIMRSVRLVEQKLRDLGVDPEQ